MLGGWRDVGCMARCWGGGGGAMLGGGDAMLGGVARCYGGGAM